MKTIAISSTSLTSPEQKYRTHGETYEQAARNGQEILELLLEKDALPVPEPICELEVA